MNVYLGGTKMGGTKRHWYEKTGYPVFINCLPRKIFNNALIKAKHSIKNDHKESKQQLKCTYVKIGM